MRSSEEGQRREERDLHFEQAVRENKGSCVSFPPPLTSTLLLSEQDLTLIITIALLLVATLIMTAVKSLS